VIVYSLKVNGSIGYEVLKTVVMKVFIFWDIAWFSPYMNQRIGSRYNFRLENQPSKISECSKRLGRILVLLVFDSEDVGDIFIRNIGSYNVSS
jgi:hypothetical protein